MRKAFLTAAVCAVVIGGNWAAEAATISCPGTAQTSDREFGLTTSVAATCLTTGSGNINGNNDPINNFAPGYTTIDKSDNTTAYVGADGELSVVVNAGGLSGSFSFTPPAGYQNFVLALKSGDAQIDPTYAAFLLPAGVTSGTWTISGDQAFSHANLYGQACPQGGCPNPGPGPSPVPLPAPFLLLGVAIGGLGAVRWLKKRNASA